MMLADIFEIISMTAFAVAILVILWILWDLINEMDRGNQ